MTTPRELADRLENECASLRTVYPFLALSETGRVAAQMLRALAEQQEQWQPIETAPKDGTRILCVLSPYQAAIARWGCNRWLILEPDDFSDADDPDDQWRHYVMNTDYLPTHWMPLPAPPAAARTQEPKT